MTLKTLAAAATLAVLTTTGASAATFNFSFDSSTAIDGDRTIKASGTLNIDAGAGASFSDYDVSDVSIVVSSDTLQSFTFTDFWAISGTIAADGSSAHFDNFALVNGDLTSGFGCIAIACLDSSKIDYQYTRDAYQSTLVSEYRVVAEFSTPAAAQAALVATTQVSAAPVSAVPLPAGGLLLLSGLGGVAALKRRKKRAA